ncbi:MAG: prepilin-type N-terminal cleavage/methylation domain-containing protein [Gammaproteobacteria bacterium]|nr:prepilin-type N-terminal cleavage/methylation domain-containing protein [Gammaproteobacteria bacterium]MDH5654160.1 prepilin-type N-terminal cleavage/methylation domain-containing protein [Gammaproteobacteria bacterium]
MRRSTGLTLVELLVTLVILSILASAAIPYAEVTVRRNKELDLSRSLREIRTAIDRFHADWQAGKISKISAMASVNGYPRELRYLVEGVPIVGSTEKRKYLRRIPYDPLLRDKSGSPESGWRLVGYTDKHDSLTWGGEDVYDVRSSSDQQALDQSRYTNW